MSREFSKREIALILILTVTLLGLLYYQFVYLDIQNKKDMYDAADIDTEIMIEQTKYSRIQQMQNAIDAGKENDTTGYVETYNNLKAEINLLNDILEDADTFSLDFEQATAVDDAVRRNIAVTFTASDYTKARSIIKQLHDSKYRCLIRDMTISAQADQNVQTAQEAAGNELDLNNGPVSVDLTVEFFETLYGATTTDGLDIQDSSASEGSSESLTDTLSNETETYENME